jgi:hypothetical protein
MRNLFLLILLILNIEAFGQAEIWLYDGDMMSVLDFKIDSDNVYYLKNSKVHFINKDEVFVVINGKDTIYIYESDTIAGYPKERFFFYLKGLNDGFRYNNLKVISINALLGMSGAIILPMAGFNGFFVALPPLATTVIFALSDVKHIPKSEDSLYELGYKESARKKRVVNALTGAVTGITVGSIILYIATK